jgi:outer membrane immunogenic protein
MTGVGMRICVLVSSVFLASSALAQDYDDQSTEEFTPDSQVQESSSGGGWDYDWSGNYYGMNLGYSLGHQGSTDIANIVSGEEMVSGAVFGGYTGQNFQLSRIVLGTEADFSLAKVSGRFELPGSAWACGTSSFGCENSVEWFGSIRGRAGFAVNSLLPYATAGVALAGVDSVFKGAGVNQRVNGFGYGYVFGGGLEYSVMKNITIRGEALHYQLSDVKETVGLSEIAVETAFNVVRLGVDVKF